MIKLQDFATQQGVTDRQIQRLLKKYESEMEGTFERKGPNGTWLSDEACDILRSKMKQAPAAVFEPDPRVGQLQQELDDTKAMAKDLWEQLKKKDDIISQLVIQNNELRLKADSAARLEADNEIQKAKVLEAEKAAQEAIAAVQEEAENEKRILEGFIEDAKKEIVAVKEEVKAELTEKDKRIQELENRSRWQRFLDVFK